MNTTDITVFAGDIDVKRFGGQLHIYDAPASLSLGRDIKIGTVELVRGFVHYTGVKGSTHEGVHAIIRPVNGDPMLTLETELRKGLKNGRNDSAS